MIILIDGHNLIGKLGDLSLQDPDDEQKLVTRLHQYALRTGRRVIVVFDSGSHSGSSSRKTLLGVDVIYAKPGHTADQRIIAMVRKASSPRQITVVTSDRDLAGVVRAEGALVMGAEDFARQMQPPVTEDERAEEDERTNVHLSKKEVDAWLAVFQRARQEKSIRRNERRR